RARGQDRGRTADQLFKTADIFNRLGRQIGPRAGMRGFFSPTGDRLVDRLDARLGMLARRQIINLSPIQPISDTNLDLVETIEDIELGQRQTLNAAGAYRLPYQNRVEPTAASWSAGNDAEFLAAFAKRLTDFVDLLGRKRPRAD